MGSGELTIRPMEAWASSGVRVSYEIINASAMVGSDGGEINVDPASDPELDGSMVFYNVRVPVLVADPRRKTMVVCWETVMMNEVQIQFLVERVKILAGYLQRLAAAWQVHVINPW